MSSGSQNRVTLRRLRDGLNVQKRVIHALMIRELITRYGRENIGFLWMMVEPLLFAVLVSIIWRFLRGPVEHGVGIVPFIVTGYVPLTLFRHAIGRSVAIFQANSSLIYHRQVQIVDFVVARFLIEMLGSMMGFVFIAALLVGLDEFPVPSDFGLMIGGWLTYCFFSFAICLVVAPLSEMSEVIEKFVPVLTYIMIPFSGTFSLVAWLTPSVQKYVLWSPFVHAMEMMRSGIWGPSLEVHYNIWVPITSSTVILAAGLALCRHVRRDLAVE